MLTSWSRTFSTVSRSVRIEAFFVRTKSFRDVSRRFLAAGIPRRFCLRCVLLGHVGRVAPQPFQSIEAPAILSEDVKDEIAEVDQNPAAGGRSFDETRLDAFGLTYLVDDAIGDRLRLPLCVR